MSKSKLVLGKGLSALIPSVTEATSKPVSVKSTPESRDDGKSIGVIAHVEIAKVHPNPYQPREEFDPTSLKELSQSIISKGVIQPITVRRYGTGEYQLISGERRVRACKAGGIKFIPAYILDITTKEEMLELALIENIQRERLNPIEIAHSYQRLISECKYTQDIIAQKVGKDRTTVANFIRLLKLPEEIQKSIVSNEISMGHARALINIPDRKKQMKIWNRIVKDRLSVRLVEKLVQDLSTLDIAPTKKDSKKFGNNNASRLEGAISHLKIMYGTGVKIHVQKSGKGSVVIDFYSSDDFDRILDILLTKKHR